MKLPTAKTTKKKFYNKYIYKITLNLPGASALRWYNFSQLLDMCHNGFNDKETWREHAVEGVLQNSEYWVRLCIMLSAFDSKSFAKRLEGSNIDFYTNDVNLYTNLGKEFTEHVKYRSQPKKGTENTLLTSDKKIYVNHLPYNKYEYRVYLHPHKLDVSARKSVADWLTKQVPKVTFTESLYRWLVATNDNYDRRYIQVQDNNTLLMLQLRAPNIIGKVFKYIINR
jgi:hypothetical protein